MSEKKKITLSELVYKTLIRHQLNQDSDGYIGKCSLVLKWRFVFRFLPEQLENIKKLPADKIDEFRSMTTNLAVDLQKNWFTVIPGNKLVSLVKNLG